MASACGVSFVRSLDGEQKRAIKDTVAGVFDWAEERAYFRRAPVFELDYHHEYPGLSILEPHQYITTHFGYYKGFLRYHLGVIVPGNNLDHSSWLRVNADKADNDRDDHSLIERGEKYDWHEGEGMMFDDTFLHDAANDSDGVRVILRLDIARKMPWWLHAFNKLCLFIIQRDESIRSIRKNATIV